MVKLFFVFCGISCIAAASVIGPKWTYNSAVEKPAGEKVIGSYTISVYTKEQQERLGVNELGEKVEKPARVYCQALVAGGDGSSEAYVAGAIKGLVDNRNAHTSEWDVIVGTGTPVTSTLAGTYALGTEADMATAIYNAVTQLTQADVYQNWNDGNDPDILASHSGLYNNSILASTLQNILGSRTQSNRVSSVSATDLSDGNLYTYSSTQNSFSQAVLASAAIPGTFPMVEVEGKNMVSGSVRMAVDVFHAINICRGKGAFDQDISVDIILTAAATLATIDPASLLCPKVNDRNTDIKAYDSVMNDVGWAKIAYPKVKFRELVFPSTALPSDNLQYNSADLDAMAAQGKSDAINSIHMFKAQVSGSCPHPSSDHEIPCSQDRDCYSWAVSHCADAYAAETSRCNMHVDSVDSFGACEFDKYHARTCCVDHPWMKRKVSKRPPVTTRQRTDLSSKCHAVAVSGGGDRGSYEAGLLKGLVTNLPANEVEWAVVTGISVGSIVGAGMTLYKIGNETAMADYLVEVALSLNKKAIYTDWSPLGIITGLCCKTGLYNTAPERSFLTNIFGGGPLSGPGTRVLSIGATELNRGLLQTWNETVQPNVLVNALMASSAIPGAFEMIRGVRDPSKYYSDGGTKMGVDVFNTVVRCRDLGYADEDIIVDTLLTAGLQPLTAVNVANYNYSDVNNRVSDLQTFDDTMDAVGWGAIAYPDVTWRYTIMPSSPLPGDGKSFDPAQMQQMVEQGEADAKAAVDNKRACDNDSASCKRSCSGLEHNIVRCSIDKDCYNWGVAKCGRPLKTSKCITQRRKTGLGICLLRE